MLPNSPPMPEKRPDLAPTSMAFLQLPHTCPVSKPVAQPTCHFNRGCKPPSSRLTHLQHQVVQLPPSCRIHPQLPPCDKWSQCLGRGERSSIISEPLTQPACLCFSSYVCPVGSSSPHAPSNACPPGTFSNHLHLFDKSQCETCPARFVCTRGV